MVWKLTGAIYITVLTWWLVRHLSAGLFLPSAFGAPYLLACLALIVVWGGEPLKAEPKRVARAAAGAGGFTLLLGILVLSLMAVPHDETLAICHRPGFYCEDFTGAVMMYVFWAVALIASGLAAFVVLLRNGKEERAPA